MGVVCREQVVGEMLRLVCGTDDTLLVNSFDLVIFSLIVMARTANIRFVGTIVMYVSESDQLQLDPQPLSR